jgi:hypothetical protein
MTDEDEDEVATKKKKNHPKKKKVSKEAPKKTIKKKEAPKKKDTILKKDKCNLKKAGKNVKVMAVINLMEITINCSYTKVFNKK